uniref:zinc-ribbon domain-containing protein n=1 Tax=Parerythrobacter lutipelagi TaxID=1964208 RepID=UPI0010F4CA3C|nr:zinc-ribbon domain-containing protein [Parerythrobacter lutipelagi]
MIIACPACSTRYVVPDSAIGVDGRTVRCAKCRHSWFQDGPEIKLPGEPATEAVPTPKPGFDGVQRNERARPASGSASPPAPTHASAQASSRVSTPASPSTTPSPSPVADDEDGAPPPPIQREAKAGVADEITPPVVETTPAPEPESFDDDHSQFDYQPPFRGRRNPLKIWTAAAAVFALLATGTVIAASYYGFPDWVPVSRPTFGLGDDNLVLDFPADQQERRTLPNGTEFYGASGTITNTGRETVSVPSILIVMRDQRERPVYSWEVVPPQDSLAPGESMTINEAVTNVPKSAKFAEIGWKAQR